MFKLIKFEINLKESITFFVFHTFFILIVWISRWITAPSAPTSKEVSTHKSSIPIILRYIITPPSQAQMKVFTSVLNKDKRSPKPLAFPRSPKWIAIVNSKRGKPLKNFKELLQELAKMTTSISEFNRKSWSLMIRSQAECQEKLPLTERKSSMHLSTWTSFLSMQGLTLLKKPNNPGFHYTFLTIIPLTITLLKAGSRRR